MARTAINVNKQSVAQLLETGKTTPFVIPEYQRPYGLVRRSGYCAI